jgi:hypothetical protein
MPAFFPEPRRIWCGNGRRQKIWRRAMYIGRKGHGVVLRVHF